MLQINHFLLGGIACVLLFDTVGSIASKKLSFNYAHLSVISLLIYMYIGYYSGKETGPVIAGVVCFAVGLVDSTIGWKISWLIGPGKPPSEFRTRKHIIKTIIIMTLLAGLIGYITASYTTNA